MNSRVRTTRNFLIVQSAVHTLIALECIFYMYYYFRYVSSLPNPWDFMERMDDFITVTIVIDGGGLIGACVAWLVFPQNYFPQSWKDRYPKVLWACLLLGLPFLLVQFNLLPDRFVPLWVIQDTVLLLGCPLITYFLFYTILAYLTRNLSRLYFSPVE